MTGHRIAILYGQNPWLRTDGGSVRVQALHAALEPLGVTTLYPEGDGAFLPPGSRRKQLKQRYLPLPLRRRGLLQQMAVRLDEVAAEAVVCASHALTPVPLRRPGQPVWVDHFDRWSDFGRREAAQRRGVPRFTARLQAELWARRERQERQRYSVATAASFDDARTVPDACWLPTPVARTVDRLRAPAGRQIGFLANFGYWPNRDAYDVLVTAWLPALRKQGWSVVVAGYESEKLPTTEGIHPMGSIASLQEFYSEVDVVVAPVRLGGGMKVKVVEALAHGRPVVATTHAVEGLPPALQPHIAVVKDVPLNLERQLGQLDLSDALVDALAPFQPEAFAHQARALAEQLLATSP